MREARGPDDGPRKRGRVDGVGHERERAPGHAAAARFLARMRPVEDGDARPAPSEHVRRTRAGRTRADDGYVKGQGILGVLGVLGVLGALRVLLHTRATLHGHG